MHPPARVENSLPRLCHRNPFKSRSIDKQCFDYRNQIYCSHITYYYAAHSHVCLIENSLRTSTCRMNHDWITMISFSISYDGGADYGGLFASKQNSQTEETPD